jgi:NAD-dependent SIR2 family protein deacetylase
MTRQQAIPLAANPAPASAPGTALDKAAAILSGSVFAVLTGAGLSTDSGIPDYRGEGAPVRSPMTFDQFVSDSGYRKRYWAGSHQGWRRFSNAKPNQGHSAIAALEVAGFANGVITQNVDGLHTRAGSPRVVDLHGTMDRVRCLHCGQYYARQQIAERLSASNPWLDDEALVELSPDGDAQVHGFSDFVTRTAVCAVGC